jgi:hypothetical protein
VTPGRVISLTGTIPSSDVRFNSENRAITHTIRLLQDFFRADREDTVGGPSWSDRLAPVDRIQLEMDALLTERILPSLTTMFRGKALPSQHKRLTVLALVGSFVDDPGHNVPWSLAFAVHCILSAVFEM